jgi:hypothetical protein
MIFVTLTLPVNEFGHPEITREKLWRGMVARARGVRPGVPALARREITERVTIEAPHQVVFTRMSGPVRGTIVTEIETDDRDGSLSLRFTFALTLHGVPQGSAEERALIESATGDHLRAVESMLTGIREAASGMAA